MGTRRIWSSVADMPDHSARLTRSAPARRAGSPAAPARSRCRRPAPRAPGRTGPARRSRSSSSGWPRSTRSPGLARQITPAPALTGSSLRARPAPSRHAATPTASASSRRSQPDSPARSRPGRARPTGSGASGSPPWPAIISRYLASARPSASACAGSVGHDAGQRQHLPRQRQRDLDQVGRTAAAQHLRPPRPPRPRCRRPGRAARPSRSAARWCAPPTRCPAAPWSAPAPAPRPMSRMNAPLPTFTSSTSALVPSAIFLDMIELAISGMDSTVPVTSRRAYSLRSAGARSSPAAQMTRRP